MRVNGIDCLRHRLGRRSVVESRSKFGKVKGVWFLRGYEIGGRPPAVEKTVLICIRACTRCELGVVSVLGGWKNRLHDLGDLGAPGVASLSFVCSRIC